MRSVTTILFTDRYKVSEKRNFVSDQIPWIANKYGSLPPQFISWDGKLWKHTGSGVTADFYHEVESFVQVS